MTCASYNQTNFLLSLRRSFEDSLWYKKMAN